MGQDNRTGKERAQNVTGDGTGTPPEMNSGGQGGYGNQGGQGGYGGNQGGYQGQQQGGRG